MRYGDLVTIVQNTKRNRNTAYTRFKNGIRSKYMVCWKSFDNRQVEGRYVNPDGKITSAYYVFPIEDVAPLEFFHKKLEDCL
jgi:hypothetical protein